MKYAYVREELVEFTEGRGPLQNYYPPGLLTSFVPVPDGLEQAVCTGWRYREGQFTEPEVMSEIPTIGGVYIPSNKEKTAEYIMDMENKIRQAENNATEMEQEAIGLGQLVTESQLNALEETNHE